MKIPTLSRLAGRSLLVCSLGACASVVQAQQPASAGAQPAVTPSPASTPVELEPYAITATRTLVPLTQLGSAVTIITPQELERRQVRTLFDALSGAAGSPVQTGGAGGTTSLFIRGSNSGHTLFVVDGIRASDANAGYSSLVGGAAANSTDRIEVVRGPQSLVYGADAIGGVVSIAAECGAGEPRGTVSAEAGSFGTVRGGVSAQGERGDTAYNSSFGVFSTQNERENNDFESYNAVVRVDHKAGKTVGVGGTVRVFRGQYGSPGAVIGFGANDPDNQEDELNVLATTYAEFRSGPDWSGRITLGAQQRELVSKDPTFASETNSMTRRGVLDAQASYSGFDRHRVTIGGTGEWQHYRSNGFGAPAAHILDTGVFAQDEWTPVERLTLTAGARRDEFESFGGKTTGRGTIAWQAVPETIKLRGSYGTGFRAPSLLELYGLSAGTFRGNPSLRPEESQGWDAGLDYTNKSKLLSVGLTYFENKYTDLINGFAFVGGPEPFTAQNTNEARSSGVEFSSALKLTETLRFSADYTYTEATDGKTERRLLRRPRHAANLDVWNDFGGGFSAGAGLRVAADMADIDAVSGARLEGEDYAVSRIYAAWALNERFTLTSRIENLFDESYSAVNGYPSLGIGYYAGAEWKF
jgi:vitamin B12 transporter